MALGPVLFVSGLSDVGAGGGIRTHEGLRHRVLSPRQATIHAFCPLDLALVPPQVRALLTTDKCRWRIKTTLSAFQLHRKPGNRSDSSPTSAEQAPISIRGRRFLIIQIFTLDHAEKSHITKLSTRRFYARNRRTRLQQIQPERALKKKGGGIFSHDPQACLLEEGNPFGPYQPPWDKGRTSQNH